MDDTSIQSRLEYLRGELRAERISMGELIELQGLAEHIDAGDVELLEAAGVPEFPDDVPLGIADLFTVDADSRTQTPQLDPLPDHWYWCRRHECAEPSTYDAAVTIIFGVPAGSRCVRVGPFMSEREADRLGAVGYVGSRPALGMEVE